ncbi:MAG: stage V sporulation T C-terminal domain-containing protein [bacterium]|nr:stage V sporulation T C-terminal domain-containing protein [bacterium]
MKSTGVIRRIDDLGRFVIPKEIRRNLKIREGDTLEIYVENQKIVLSKFSFMSDLIEVANKLVSTASGLLKKKILITNTEKIIACSAHLEDQYLNQSLTSFILEKIESRTMYTSKEKEMVSFIPNMEDHCFYFFVPIVVDSDSIGCVIIFDEEELDGSDCLLGSMLSSFLEKNIEE